MNSAIKSVFSLLPDQASTYAVKVDLLYMFLVGVSVIFTILTAVLVIVFAVKYRRKSEADNPEPPHLDNKLELLCSGILLVLVMVMFGWGAALFFEGNKPPADAMEILVTGKQWMWKVQHPQGKREINELHVPAGQPIKLNMTSEDVIHSFFIPAFRVKNDALPGRYTAIWFNATKPGSYNLFCAEYCGTEHSYMGGWVHVVSQADYEKWVRGASVVQDSPVVAGGKLFAKFGCATCHADMPGLPAAARGPSLAGIYGHEVEFADGTKTVVDDAYLRESIVNSQAKLVKGFLPIMPAFQGLITEEQVMQLIAYIKSLTASGGTGGNG